MKESSIQTKEKGKQRKREAIKHKQIEREKGRNKEQKSHIKK